MNVNQWIWKHEVNWQNTPAKELRQYCKRIKVLAFILYVASFGKYLFYIAATCGTVYWDYKRYVS